MKIIWEYIRDCFGWDWVFIGVLYTFLMLACVDAYREESATNSSEATPMLLFMGIMTVFLVAAMIGEFIYYKNLRDEIQDRERQS